MKLLKFIPVAALLAGGMALSGAEVGGVSGSGGRGWGQGSAGRSAGSAWGARGATAASAGQAAVSTAASRASGSGVASRSVNSAVAGRSVNGAITSRSANGASANRSVNNAVTSRSVNSASASQSFNGASAGQALVPVGQTASGVEAGSGGFAAAASSGRSGNGGGDREHHRNHDRDHRRNRDIKVTVVTANGFVGGPAIYNYAPYNGAFGITPGRAGVGFGPGSGTYFYSPFFNSGFNPLLNGAYFVVPPNPGTTVETFTSRGRGGERERGRGW